LTSVHRTESRAEARRLLGWLRAAGIAARIESEPTAGFVISVDPAEALEAASVLGRVLAEPGREVVWICPACAEENASTFEICWRCSGSLDTASAREADPPLPSSPEAETRLGESAVGARRRALELTVLLCYFVGWPRLSTSLDAGDPVGLERVLSWLGLDLVALSVLLAIASADRAAFPRGRGGPVGWAMACGIGVVLGVVLVGVTDFAYSLATRDDPYAVLFPEPEFVSSGVRSLWRGAGYLWELFTCLFFVRFVIERVRSFAPLVVAIAASCLLPVAAYATTVPEAIYLVGAMGLPAVVYAYLRDVRPVILALWIARTIWMLPLL